MISTIEILLAAKEVYDEKSPHYKKRTLTRLVERTGKDEQECFDEMMDCCDRGLIDNYLGVSSSFITSAGEEFLRQHGGK